MRSNRLWGIGALAIIDVLLALATNLIADEIGGPKAFLIAGTVFLAISVTLGRALLGRDAPVERSEFSPGRRRTLLAVSMIGALALFGVASANASAGTRPPTPGPTSAGPAPTLSPSPSPMSLSMFYARWRAGPVKIAVEHYNAWVSRAADKDDIDATLFDMRVGIRNESTDDLDLTAAPGSLVLVMNAAFPADTYRVDQKTIGEVPAAWRLYCVGFDNDGREVTVGGKEHVVKWTGGRIGVGADFTGSSLARNGIEYVVPPPSGKSATEVDAIAPGQAHVLGIGWLSPDGRMLGYTPVTQWAGPNTFDAVLKT